MTGANLRFILCHRAPPLLCVTSLKLVGFGTFQKKNTSASWGGIPSFPSLFQRILWGKSGVCIGEFCLRVGIIEKWKSGSFMGSFLVRVMVTNPNHVQVLLHPFLPFLLD